MQTAPRSCCVIPQARYPNVSHLSGVGHQVQAFIHLSIDDGERTVLGNLLVNSTGAEGFCVATRPHLEGVTTGDAATNTRHRKDKAWL